MKHEIVNLNVWYTERSNLLHIESTFLKYFSINYTCFIVTTFPFCLVEVCSSFSQGKISFQTNF